MGKDFLGVGYGIYLYAKVLELNYKQCEDKSNLLIKCMGKLMSSIYF